MVWAGDIVATQLLPDTSLQNAVRVAPPAASGLFTTVETLRALAFTLLTPPAAAAAAELPAPFFFAASLLDELLRWLPARALSVDFAGGFDREGRGISKSGIKVRAFQFSKVPLLTFFPLSYFLVTFELLATFG